MISDRMKTAVCRHLREKLADSACWNCAPRGKLRGSIGDFPMTYHLAEMEPKGGAVRNYILRVFEGDGLRRDPATGQPWKKYCGMCVLTVRNRVCEIQAIESLKHSLRCLAVMRGPVADDLDLADMWGERWDEETETKTVVRVPLRRSAKPNPPPRRGAPLRSWPGWLAPSIGLLAVQRRAGTSRRSVRPPAASD